MTGSRLSMNTQELRLAILHKMISEMEDAGKTQLQKLGYFLQEALDVPTKYPFKMHHYGPYAEALETDTARLRLAGYVDIQPDLQGDGFHITPIDSPPEAWSQLICPYNQSISRAIETFRDWQTHELELAATIHFVRKLLSDAPKNEVVNKVNALKPKFDKEYITGFYAELEQLNLLEGVEARTISDM